MHHKVAVVILNYNNLPFLQKFLPDIVKFSAPHAVIIADNGSSDKSLEFARTNFPSVSIIENKGNYGYAEGYNKALHQVQSEFYVLLNSDVQVTANWIGPVLDLMETDPLIGACQPKVLDYVKRDLFEYAGAAGGFIDKYGYPFCRGRLFNTIETDDHQYDYAQEVFWATGACMFVRASAFKQCGGFDPKYFAHMEEIDLCWRMKNFGYKIYAEPASTVYHVGGGTLSKISAQKTYLNFRNNLATLVKNHPPRWLFSKLLFRMILDGVAAFKFLFEGAPSHFISVIKAHFVFYSWLPGILQQRRKLRKQSGFQFTLSQVYNGTIVAEHFIRGRRKLSDLGRGFFAEEKETAKSN
jgi:GT2 family glycosyltransferase